MAIYQPPSDTASQAPASRVRGVLDLCVLALIAEAPAHGYAIAQGLEAAGVGTVKGGTLYPLLARLEGQGLLAAGWRSSAEGPPRKTYALTDAGRTHLRAEGGAWLALADAAAGLLRAADADHPPDRAEPR